MIPSDRDIFCDLAALIERFYKAMIFEQVHCAHEVCKRTQTPSMTFAEVGEASFKLGPPRLRRFSSFARCLFGRYDVLYLKTKLP